MSPEYAAAEEQRNSLVTTLIVSLYLAVGAHTKPERIERNVFKLSLERLAA
jgi:hypothetical protein